MNNSVFMPFTKATSEVFKLLLDLDVSTGTPEVSDGAADTAGKISIVIGITGDLSGKILYRFPVETTLEMVKIMSGMEIEEIDEFVTSALGEVANIISGNAMTDLSSQQIVCDILPPQVVSGDDQHLCSGDVPITHAKVETPIGILELDIQVN